MNDSERKPYVPMQGFGAGRLDRTVDLGTVRRRRPPSGLILAAVIIALGVVAYFQWPAISSWLTNVPTPSSAPPVDEPAPGNGSVPADARPATVDYVHDGDTLFLDMESGEHLKVRLLGIDAPEIGDNAECFGNEARDELRSLLPEGSPVSALAVAREKDRFGRSLFYVFTDAGTNVNESLVSTGAASVLLLGERDSYWDELEAAEGEARAAGAGLWGAC